MTTQTNIALTDDFHAGKQLYFSFDPRSEQMELPFVNYTVTAANIPYNTISFSNGSKLDWSDGTLRFSGSIDDSAKVFFNEVFCKFFKSIKVT